VSSEVKIDAAGDPVDTPWWWPHHRETVSALISCLVHATLLIVLALIVDDRSIGMPGIGLRATMDDPAALENLLEENSWAQFDVTPNPVAGAMSAESANSEANDVPLPDDGQLQPTDAQPEVAALQAARPTDWMASVDSQVGGGVEGRNPEARGAAIALRGGTRDSEDAVVKGLNWLAAHQGRDGGWRFDLKNGACNGYCRNPGTSPTKTGATGLALLAFLGANHTHLTGQHRDVVRKGLYYLGEHAKLSADGADLCDGTMYGQGIATLALCEAYAMTDDPGLKDLAQKALDYIVYAQDRKGGGWRYTPGTPGDTTVTGWQWMALKSGRMARLQVSQSPFYLAQRFLDSVASSDGSQFGYMTREPRRATTAVGLLCRMYSGWRHENPTLARGVSQLAAWGPSDIEMYYNYYATQVMFHWGGSDWERWNRKLQASLIRSQATQGHESGSWYFDDIRCQPGGRLYATAMAVLILEVYYRYMPLYGDQVFKQ
jgi:hypothetical protein